MNTDSAKLIIEISRDICLQNYEQLENSIANSKARLDPNNDSDKYLYENRVIRAGRHLKLLRNIINNFDKSIFDGIIKKDEILFADYGANNELMYRRALRTTNRPDSEIEMSFVKDGIDKLFWQLGINVRSLQHSIYYSLRKIENKGAVSWEFRNGSKIAEGNLNINNLLDFNMTNNNSQLSRDCSTDPVFYDQNVEFFMDCERTYSIIKRFLSEKLQEVTSEDIINIFVDLYNMCPNGRFIDNYEYSDSLRRRVEYGWEPDMEFLNLASKHTK